LYDPPVLATNLGRVGSPRRRLAETGQPECPPAAADLAVARATVVAANDQVVAEGYLASRPGALTRVAAGSWTAEQPVTRSPRLSYRLDLVPGEPDAARFPRAAWLRCAREVLATAPHDLFGDGDPSGLVHLRAELASYLNRTRNANVAVESTIVVPGAAGGLSQMARLLHRQGATTTAVEAPGFPFHHAILRREGLRLAPVPLDDEGIDVDALAATSSHAVVVTPAHQYPPRHRHELGAPHQSRQLGPRTGRVDH
jgi:GntR family transcriptional regulator / MocR family aminotransferase